MGDLQALILWSLFITTIFLCPEWALATCGDGTWLEDGICLPKDYNRLKRPLEKTHIQTKFLVNEVLNVNDESQTMTLSTLIMYTWEEPRIMFNDSLIHSASGVHVEYQLLKELWTPDIYFYNLIHFNEMTALDKLSGVTIWGTKKVQLFSKSIQEISCTMGFVDFPFDTQTCQFYITSSVHPDDEIDFSTVVLPNDKLKEELETVRVEIAIIPEKDRTQADSLDDNYDFSIAGIVFTLERKAGSYIMRYYVPVFGMANVCMVSFLIPPDAIPGRTGLLVTLFLVLTTIFGNIQVGKPPSSISYI